MFSNIKRLLLFAVILTMIGCSTQHVLKKNEGSAFKYYSRALESFSAGRFEPALMYIDQAISINGHIAGYYELKGDILSNKRQSEEALKAYKRALQYRSNYDVVQIKIADIYFKRQEYDKAQKAYKKAIALAPEKLNLTLRLAACFLQTRDYGIAQSVLDDYKRLIAGQKADTSYYVLRAKLTYEKKDYVALINASRLAVAGGVRQRSLYLVYLRGLFYLRAWEQAYEILVNTAKSYLTATDVHFFRGLYFARKNNREDAIVQLRLAVDGGTSLYEAYELLAGFYNGEKALAILDQGKKYKNGRLINGGE